MLSNLAISARIANYGYCLPQKNAIGKVVGNANVVAHLGLFMDNQNHLGSTAAIIIYFKGMTLTKAEWISRKTELVPFTFPKQKTNPSVLVDKEWFQDVQKMWPVLAKTILEVLVNIPDDYHIRDIYFTGHAIGGAYATLAAELWKVHAKTNLMAQLYTLFSLHIITFGAPRVGNRNFARLANKNYRTTNRVTHGNDHVPHFIVKEFDGSKEIMEHSETEIWIKPVEHNCDCANGSKKPNDAKAVEYYSCPGVNPALNFNSESTDFRYHRKDLLFPSWFGRSGENPECNAGQSFFEVPHDFIHLGPYFGTMMGDCRELDFQAFEIL
ncbi:hypothetical protein G9A89_001860 [Geosiphon pyriformis]|nr:hypothetical protein G9A89_001860 [Geosiphon pyriformis]